MKTPEDYAADRLAAHAAKYRSQVARLRGLIGVQAEDDDLDARRNLRDHRDDEGAEG